MNTDTGTTGGTTASVSTSRNKAARSLTAVALILATTAVLFWGRLCETVAEQARASGQPDRARFWLDAATVFGSDSPQSMLIRTALAVDAGQFEEARSLLTRAENAGVNRDVVREQRKLVAALSGGLPCSHFYWPELLQGKEKQSELHHARFRACMRESELDAARVVLDQWHAARPDDPQCFADRGMLHYLLTQWPESIAAFERALEYNPNIADVREQLADGLLNRGQFADVVRVLQQDAQFRAPTETVYSLLAEAQVRMGRADEGLATLKAMTSEYPQSFRGQFELGRLLLQRGQLDEAVQVLEVARQIQPESFLVRSALGRALRILGQEERAAEFLSDADQASAALLEVGALKHRLQSEPGNVALRFQIGITTWNWVSREEGAQWLMGNLSMDAGHVPTHEALAEHFRLAGDTPREQFHRQQAELGRQRARPK